MSQDGVTILVGTTKGAFLIRGGSDRQRWTVEGPFCDGWPINHLIGDLSLGCCGPVEVENGTALGCGAPRTWRRTWTLQSSRRVRSMTGQPRSATRRHDELEQSTATVRRSVLADLAAGLCPRDTVRRNQTGKTAFEPGQRQGWEEVQGLRDILPPAVGTPGRPDWFCIRFCLI